MGSSRNSTESLNRAKELINDLCEREYGSPADFSDPSKIGIAYTTLTDDEIPMQVNVNLTAFCVDRYLNDRLVEHNQYNSLDMLIEHELEDLSFDDLIYFTDSQYAMARQERPGSLAPGRVARNELPESCFSTLPSTGELILLKRGETGYFRSSENTGDRKRNREIADAHNRRDGITPAQLMAMEVGSISGFDSPGADPQVYLDKARCEEIYNVMGAVQCSAGAPHFPTEGKLFKYEVAGREAFYLALDAVPHGLMGVSYDDAVIVRAEMVNGKPLVPVTPTWDAASDKCYMTLGNGSYTFGKEICEDYRVVAKVRVGPVEYAMGEMATHHDFFVTWERTPANDGDGAPRYYWGNYLDTRQKALQDFSRRASDKFKMLTEQRKPSIRAQLAAAQAEQRDKPIGRAHEREGAR